MLLVCFGCWLLTFLMWMYDFVLSEFGKMNFNNVRVPKVPGGGAIGTLIKIGVLGGLGLYGATNSLYNVDGGHRAIMFNRIAGIKEKVVTFFCVSWLAVYFCEKYLSNMNWFSRLVLSNVVLIDWAYVIYTACILLLVLMDNLTDSWSVLNKLHFTSALWKN